MKPPYLPPPLHDEPLDGWVARIAAGIYSTRTAILRDWGLPDLRNRRWLMRDADDRTLTVISDVTGIAQEQLQQMTLDRWATLGLKPDTTVRGIAGGAWTRSAGSRHCPTCLAERDGAFRLSWFLHWSHSCVRHRNLLVPTTHQTHPLDQCSGLSVAVATSLRAGHPLLEAQEFIDRLLDGPHADIHSIIGARPTREVFADLGALTRMALASPRWQQPETMLNEISARTGQDWTDLAPCVSPVPETAPSPARLALGVAQPAAVGVATALAAATLQAASVQEAAASLWWTTSQARLEASYHARTRGCSWPMARVLATNPTTRRQAGSLVLARFDLVRLDEDGRRLSPLDPSKIPATCWPEAHLPVGHSRDGISGVATAAALAMIATGRRVKGALQRLGLAHLTSRIQSDWDEVFAATDRGDHNFRDVLTLQRALASGTVPIDYVRRRHAFERAEPLSPRARHRVEAEIGRRLGPRETAFAAWYVWELLTGSDILMSEGPIDAHGTIRWAYRRQRSTWRTAQPPVLHEIAESRLFRLRIDEPLTWAPRRDGEGWFTPAQGAPRLLDGWETTRRAMRGPRARTAEDLGYDFEPAVALAVRADTTDARHLARNLQRFYAVAVEGHQTRAARRLGVSQGTLSVQIRDLERGLATTLFDRTPHGMSLRPPGRRLLEVLQRHGTVLLSKERP